MDQSNKDTRNPASVAREQGGEGGPADAAKKTVGEELFLVHLSRSSKIEPSKDDFDHETNNNSNNKKHGRTETQNQPAATVGEELWQIHCRRMQGFTPEEDDEEDDPKEGGTANKKMAPTKRTKVEKASLTVTATENHRVIHLRNRDIFV